MVSSFFCAQKPVIFVRHKKAMILWPGYQEYKTIAMWRNFLNLTNFLNEPCSNNVRFLSHFEEFLFRKTFSILLH